MLRKHAKTALGTSVTHSHFKLYRIAITTLCPKKRVCGLLRTTVDFFPDTVYSVITVGHKKVSRTFILTITLAYTDRYSFTVAFSAELR